MVEHRIDQGECDGCGKCVDICNLKLWRLVGAGIEKKVACVAREAAMVCHFCFFCKDICPRGAISLVCKEDGLMGRIVG